MMVIQILPQELGKLQQGDLKTLVHVKSARENSHNVNDFKIYKQRNEKIITMKSNILLSLQRRFIGKEKYALELTLITTLNTF